MLALSQFDAERTRAVRSPRSTRPSICRTSHRRNSRPMGSSRGRSKMNRIWRRGAGACRGYGQEQKQGQPDLSRQNSRSVPVTDAELFPSVESRRRMTREVSHGRCRVPGLNYILVRNSKNSQQEQKVKQKSTCHDVCSIFITTLVPFSPQQ